MIFCVTLSFWGSEVPSWNLIWSDEAYIYEWLYAAVQQNKFNPTLPYGQFYHQLLAIFAKISDYFGLFPKFDSGVIITWLRVATALPWLLTLLILGFFSSNVWLFILATSPVVVFWSFGLSHPDALGFFVALAAVLSTRHWREHPQKWWAFYLAALFLGASCAAKPSFAILALYPAASWGDYIISNQGFRYAKSWFAGLGFALIAILTALMLSPQYFEITATLNTLRSESVLLKNGFPGATVFSRRYWFIVLCLSFPCELALFCYAAFRQLRSGMFKIELASAFIIFGFYITFSHRFMPHYLLGLVALLMGTTFTAPLPSGRWQYGAIFASLSFCAFSLVSKQQLNLGWQQLSPAGLARSFMIRNDIRPISSLSEFNINPTCDFKNNCRSAHFWSGEHEELISTPSSATGNASPVYFIAFDSLIKSQGLHETGEKYRNFIFSTLRQSRVLFRYNNSAHEDQLFYDVHLSNYWPWLQHHAFLHGKAVPQAPSLFVIQMH